MRPRAVPQASAAELDPAQVRRFAADLAALCDIDRDRVLVAVSGGRDSIALLLLTREVIGDRCIAATVDHGLRRESAVEARWVAQLCAGFGIAHAILHEPMPERAGRTANLSARARALRYRLLEDHAAATGAHVIATGHHADDQLETLVMRLNRGAGIAGLAGVRARGGRIIRPLLGWRRSELAGLVIDQHIEAVEDPSNVSERFDRARLRKALAEVDWLDPDRWTQSARALGDAEDAIAWSVRQLETQRVTVTGEDVVLDPTGLPFELRRRLVENCVLRLDPDAQIRGPALVRMVNALDSGERAMLGDVIAVAGLGVVWRFSKAPPRRLL